MHRIHKKGVWLTAGYRMKENLFMDHAKNIDKRAAAASACQAILPRCLLLMCFLLNESALAEELSIPTVTSTLISVPVTTTAPTSIPTVTSILISAPVSTTDPTSIPTVTSAPTSTFVSIPTVTVQGSLFEKGTKKPLSRVNLYCFSSSSPEKPIKTATDATGKFSIEVPEGRLRWVVSLSGFRRLEQQDEQLTNGVNRPRIFYLEKTTYLAYETTVYGQTEKRDEKTKSLSQAQFATVPGANGDPIKAVQNLPGVNRAQGFSSQIIIEGSSPNDTRFFIDNQNVPIIFHFGGLSSVVLPEAIDHVDYLSAGFGPEYGQTTAGLVNLAIKDPKTDRMHGLFFVDLLNAGGMIEGPINDHSSFLVGLRQSYIGYALRAVVGKNTRGFSLTAVPEFRDLVLEYRNELSPKDTFKIVGVGSQDTFGFLLKQPADEDPSVRGRFSLDTHFFRVIPEWTHQYTAKVTGRTSLGVGTDAVHVDLGEQYFHIDQSVLSGRTELEDQVNDSWKSYTGIDFQNTWTTMSFQFPIESNKGGVSSTFGAGDVMTVSQHYATLAAGLYWRNVVHAPDSQWSFVPGIRLSHVSLTKENILEPRMAMKYALDHGWTLRAASGLYSQSPQPGNLDASYGNPDLKSQRAVHDTFGFEKDFREGAATGWTIANDFFYKRLHDITARSTAFISPSQPEYYNNSGYGRSYGMEFLGKYKTSSWQGWISYTLSRSTRGDAETPEALSQYDQTHLFTAVGDVAFGRNWKLSTRARYSTGNLYTPITGGIYDIDNDTYTPIRGEVYSRRMGAFFQADLRLDKKWIYDTWILTGYLDVQNVTNRKNPQEVNYSYDYRKSAVVSGLPILPTCGVRMEF